MIDWDRATELRNEIGAEDFSEVVEMFLEEMEEEIAALRDGAGADRLEDKLRFLKGSALNLGFARVAALCQTGESAAAKGQPDRIELEDLCRSYEASKAEFLGRMQAEFAARCACRARSDQEFGQHPVIGDVPILESTLLQPREQRIEGARILRLDPDQDRPEIARGFLEILEPGDVVIGAQTAQKILQRSGALRLTLRASAASPEALVSFVASRPGASLAPEGVLIQRLDGADPLDVLAVADLALTAGDVLECAGGFIERGLLLRGYKREAVRPEAQSEFREGSTDTGKGTGCKYVKCATRVGGRR